MTIPLDVVTASIYRERAVLVANLAARYPSGYAYNDPAEPAWAVVYIHTPAGQMSWHIAAADFAEFFDHVPHTPDVVWDGHDTDTKYERLQRLTKLEQQPS
ncbi:WDGH domain-containing protein [Streptomyces sp. NBC_01304]|uniref:WDGH domain-containing protein n=1 Tax=Streptomyces sp. NBC_01304 TaxID=2903818 RepID=UPI002E12671C|nr:hypothetical protein OG430_44935 [Streptomyces sp. NBC_01304]